jgi:hypothetical protein
MALSQETLGIHSQRSSLSVTGEKITKQKNPARDCDSSFQVADSHLFNLQYLNVCRKKEGLTALILPTNWTHLNNDEQLLVIINLERTSRGLAAIGGITRELDNYAQAAALKQTDPAFPVDVFGQSIYAQDYSVLSSDYLWMYDDGPGGADYNEDCKISTSIACWGHRDAILYDYNSHVYGGAGYSKGNYTFLMVESTKPMHYVFTWKSELKYLIK